MAGCSGLGRILAAQVRSHRLVRCIHANASGVRCLGVARVPDERKRYFREFVLVSAVRRGAAELLSALLGIGIILGTTGVLFRVFSGWRSANPFLLASIWLVLTLAFEFSVGHYVDGKRWRALVENYAIWDGKLWPIVLLSLIVAPFLWTRNSRQH